MGLCNFFEMKCNSDDCPWTKSVATINLFNKEVVNGKVPYDINNRSILAFWEIAKGHSAIETFCGLMNMSLPTTSKTYQETIENMLYSDSARE